MVYLEKMCGINFYKKFNSLNNKATLMVAFFLVFCQKNINKNIRYNFLIGDIGTVKGFYITVF